MNASFQKLKNTKGNNRKENNSTSDEKIQSKIILSDREKLLFSFEADSNRTANFTSQRVTSKVVFNVKILEISENCQVS